MHLVGGVPGAAGEPRSDNVPEAVVSGGEGFYDRIIIQRLADDVYSLAARVVAERVIIRLSIALVGFYESRTVGISTVYYLESSR